MEETRSEPGLRRFLLIWVGLVYVWELLYVTVVMGGVGPALQVKGPTGVIALQRERVLLPSAGYAPPSADPAWIAAFSLLVLAFGVLLWMGLSNRVSRRIYWPYFILQDLLLLAISLLTQQVTLGLYLTLILASLSMLKRTRLVYVQVTAYALLILLIAAVSLATGTTWQGLWFQIFGDTTYISLVLFVAGYLMLFNMQLRSREQIERAHAELQQAHAKLAESVIRVEELTLANERQRMARELHDTLSQGLTGIVMQLEVAGVYLRRQDVAQAQEIIQQSLSAARRTLHEARNAIDDLRVIVPSGLNLQENLRAEIDRFTTATDIVCDADLSDLSDLPTALAEPIFRMVREGLNNVARHAGASRVWLRAIRSDAEFLIELGDNGRGFDLATAEGPGHYGLIGMHERARLMDGKSSIVSSPGKGTVLQLRLPLAAAPPRGRRPVTSRGVSLLTPEFAQAASPGYPPGPTSNSDVERSVGSTQEGADAQHELPEEAAPNPVSAQLKGGEA
jgi:NarL family two-component system sensor histidine kinase YdfH